MSSSTSQNHSYHLHILVSKNVFAHLVTIDGIPEVSKDFLRILNTYYLEPLAWVFLFQILVNPKQNQTANGICKGRVRFPKFFVMSNLLFISTLMQK